MRFLIPLAALIAGALTFDPPSPALTPPAPATQEADFEAILEPALDSVYMLGIARRSSSGPETFEFIGTGWVVAPGKLATNAHVAEALLEGALKGRLVAKRSWSDREELALSPRSVRIHPAYGPWNARLKRTVVRAQQDPDAAQNLSFIPVGDLAVIDVEAGATGKPLPLADPRTSEPKLSERVVYLGFPSEGISGFPTLHAVPGHVTAKTDFFFQRAPWADCHLIHYCGPVVGGASGSPILDRSGRVIGVISAAEHNTGGSGERTSFGFAYGQRVDLVAELLEPEYDQRQRQRDQVWSLRLGELLLPPLELLELLATQHASADGVPGLDSSNLVLRRSLSLSDEGLTLPVNLEPGFRYLFLAASSDGTDVDGYLFDGSDDDEPLALDNSSDYFPLVTAGPFDERVELRYRLTVADQLMGQPTAQVLIYKYQPAQVAFDGASGGASRFLERSFVASGGPERPTWRFACSGEGLITVHALTDLELDIDLFLRIDGEVVASDTASDSVPVMTYFPADGDLIEIELALPEGTPPGAEIYLSGVASDGIKLQLLDGRTEPIEISDAELFSQMEVHYADSLAENGLTFEVLYQGRHVLVDQPLTFEHEVPADQLVVFIAYSPGGYDIDLAVREDGQVIQSDTQADPVPFVTLDPAAGARRVQVDVFESSNRSVDPIGYQYLLIQRKP
jgi:hypothetical protein